ncbi:hypothetical protein SLS58_009731 [Diplodia intermedia]|uniref:Cytochrome P450 n=1 Tax=Diplodia intermedia TaxID=856260 RepID=A0ABR3TAL8_9PEZI
MFAENVTLPISNKTVVAETWLPETFPPSPGPAVLVALLAATLFFLSRKPSTNSDFPLINPRKFHDIGGIRAKLSFVFNARHLLALGVRTPRPFRLLTDIGELTVLSARYANEIRNDPRLSFAEVISQTFHADLPGFEGFRQGTADAHMSRDVANKQLTRSLASLKPSRANAPPHCKSSSPPQKKVDSSRRSGGQQYNDAVAWFEQDAPEQQRGSDYDPVVAQLILAQAAIETTTDLLTRALLDLAAHPDCHGGPADGRGGRGDRQGRGTVIGVAGTRMWDADVHENPARFDGYRLHRTRGDNSSRQHQAHLVGTSADHLAFGHGKHACAGRFFVAHEAKIALSHLLLEYDWKVADRSPDPEPFEFGLTLVANPKAVVSIRARKAEMEL